MVEFKKFVHYLTRHDWPNGKALDIDLKGTGELFKHISQMDGICSVAYQLDTIVLEGSDVSWFERHATDLSLALIAVKGDFLKHISPEAVIKNPREYQRYASSIERTFSTYSHDHPGKTGYDNRLCFAQIIKELLLFRNPTRKFITNERFINKLSYFGIWCISSHENTSYGEHRLDYKALASIENFAGVVPKDVPSDTRHIYASMLENICGSDMKLSSCISSMLVKQKTCSLGERKWVETAKTPNTQKILSRL